MKNHEPHSFIQGLLVKLVLFLSIITLATSCELPGHLLLVNQFERNIIATISSTEYEADKQSVELSGWSKSSIVYGHGFSWNKPTLDSYISSIQSVVYISGSDATALEENEIGSFFASGKRDVFNKRLTVKIDSSLFSFEKHSNPPP